MSPHGDCKQRRRPERRLRSHKSVSVTNPPLHAPPSFPSRPSAFQNTVLQRLHYPPAPRYVATVVVELPLERTNKAIAAAAAPACARTIPAFERNLQAGFPMRGKKEKGKMENEVKKKEKNFKNIFQVKHV
uniref:Uncharacterized protein n=1 Tax=Physcomitrium patens TaxID=3218 RepID=A0A2K1JPB5_PHYPA|nr:hypothetical protein PHYPA_015741 [Physcomitrium patens]